MDLIAPYSRELIATVLLVVGVSAGFLARRVLLSRLAAVAARTESVTDDRLVASLRGPLPLWATLAGVYLAMRVLEPSPELAAWVAKVLLALLIGSVTWWAAGLGGRLLEPAAASGDSVSAPVAGVVRRTVQVVVLATGALVLLGSLGISVAPVLTTLGIGGLAVALGLQDTLSNLFAGIHLTLAGNIRVGDFVRLESGEEGYVEDIRWRATCLRTLPNSVVLIPNSRLAQNVVTNYDLPSREVAVLVEVGAHYASDLQHVERVTVEVAREVMRRVPGAATEFDPFIRFHTFGESSIDFTVILRAQRITDQFLLKHEFVKALARTFDSEGIVIPFPIRALNMEQERRAGKES
jgi:small-conductance mechanosensitive channel